MRTLIVVFLIVISNTLFATHIRGGYIAFKHINGLTYEATLYLSTTNISVPPDMDSLEINWGDGNSSSLLRVAEDSITGRSLKVNQYKGNHTFSSEGDYLLSFNSPNRTMVGNISNSTNQPIYLETFLRAYPLTHCENSSPLFIDNGLPLDIYNGSFITVALNANDSEGDSLIYELVTPMRGANLPVVGYVSPGQVGAPSTFSIGSYDANIMWDRPNTLGYYAIAVKVSEWKNGFLYGYTIMETALIVTDQNGFNIGDYMNPNILQQPGYTLSAGDTLKVEGLNFGSQSFAGEKYSLTLFSENLPVDTQSTYSGDTVYFNMQYVADASHARDYPYCFIIRGNSSKDAVSGLYNYYDDMSIRVKVNGGIPSNCSEIPLSVYSKKESEVNMVSVYPNPATQTIMIQTDNVQSVIKGVIMFDVTGKIVHSQQMTDDSKIISFNISAVANGLYFLHIKMSNGQRVVRKVVKE